MSKEDKKYAIPFTRDELVWLQLHVMEARHKSEGRITKITEPVGKVLSDEQNKEVTQLRTHIESCEQFLLHIQDTLNNHDRKRLELDDQVTELKEIIELVDEPEAKELARQTLKGLPDKPSITVNFSRNILKFVLNNVENDLQKLRTSIIPRYEQMKPEEFTDPLRTKSFYINRNRRTKNTLERMKTRLEKGL